MRTSLKKGVLSSDGPCLIEKERMTIASLLQENGYKTAMNGVLTYLENDRVLDPPILWTKKKHDITPRTYRMTPPYESEPQEGSQWVEALFPVLCINQSPFAPLHTS